MFFLFSNVACFNTKLSGFICSVIEEQAVAPPDNRWKVYFGVAAVLILIVAVVIICSSGTPLPDPGDSFDPSPWGTPISSPQSSPLFEELSEELLQELAEESGYFDDGAGVFPRLRPRFITPESSFEHLPDLVDNADLVSTASQIIT